MIERGLIFLKALLVRERLITDDGGPEMAHVHLLGDVGAGEVNDDLLLLPGVREMGRSDAADQERVHLGHDKVLLEEDVDEPGAGRLHLLDHPVVLRHKLDNLERDIAGRHLDPLALGTKQYNII